MAKTRKITIEVEVPEGLSEVEVRRYLEKSLRKLAALAEMERSGEARVTGEVLELLGEIKRRVAERSR